MTTRLALGLAVLLGAASARGEGLFGPDEVKPEPVKPPPAVPEPPKPKPAQAQPAPAAEALLPVPAAHRMSKPSSTGEARTAAGVRIVEATESGAKEAWFTVERWASKEKAWVKAPFNVKKGENIGGDKKIGPQRLDFSTSWMLLDIKKETRTYPGDPISEFKMGDDGKPIRDEAGNFVKVTRPGPVKTRTVSVAVLRHVRARVQDGSPLQARIDLGSGIAVDLPKVSEDELPPAPPGP